MGANTLLAQDSKASKIASIPYPSGANLANNPRFNTIPSVKLNNGIFMPILGFGTLKLGNQKETQKYVEQALEVGFRLFDTAQSYGNEEGVGRAIKSSGIRREEKRYLSLLSFLKPMRQRIRQEKPMMRA